MQMWLDTLPFDNVMKKLIAKAIFTEVAKMRNKTIPGKAKMASKPEPKTKPVDDDDEDRDEDDNDLQYTLDAMDDQVIEDFPIDDRDS